MLGGKWRDENGKIGERQQGGMEGVRLGSGREGEREDLNPRRRMAREGKCFREERAQKEGEEERALQEETGAAAGRRRGIREDGPRRWWCVCVGDLNGSSSVRDEGLNGGGVESTRELRSPLVRVEW